MSDKIERGLILFALALFTLGSILSICGIVSSQPVLLGIAIIILQVSRLEGRS